MPTAKSLEPDDRAGLHLASDLRSKDDRRVHLLTRGNVDGIVSAALFLARDPGARITFVPSGDMAVDVLRKDIASHEVYLVDLGLTPRLIKTLNDKAKTRQKVTYLDHHEQSGRDGYRAPDHQRLRVALATVVIVESSLEEVFQR